MHPEALDWVSRWVPDDPVAVLDVGGRDINGSPAGLFPPGSTFEVVDLYPADNVTWVGDVLEFEPPVVYDVGLYLEVAEHAYAWSDHVRHIANLLDPRSGLFVFTAAGPARAPHSAVDGGPVQPGEHYANVESLDVLGDVLDSCFNHYVVDVAREGEDVRGVAWR